jgi:hypothetical protein
LREPSAARVALPAPDDELIALEVDVLYAQPAALEQSQSGSVGVRAAARTRVAALPRTAAGKVRRAEVVAGAG